MQIRFSAASLGQPPKFPYNNGDTPLVTTVVFEDGGELFIYNTPGSNRRKERHGTQVRRDIQRIIATQPADAQRLPSIDCPWRKPSFFRDGQSIELRKFQQWLNEQKQALRSEPERLKALLKRADQFLKTVQHYRIEARRRLMLS